MKGISIGGFRKEKLRISSRKDWVIFWFFAVMIAYVAGGWLDRRVDEWLRGTFSTPWLTQLNEPSNYGRTIVAVVLLAVLAEAVLFLGRKPVKAKLAVLAASLVLLLAVIGIHQVHCRLIVSVLWKEEPQRVTINLDGNQEHWGKGEERLVSEAECQELLELCRSLEVITDSEELEACLAWYDRKGDIMGADDIWLSFSQKYGHGYVLDLHIQDGYIYLWRGYNGHTPKITFFEDNGLVEWLEGRSR